MTTEDKPIRWTKAPADQHDTVKLTESDNVAVALRNIAKDETVADVKATEDIPKGHKVALTNIKAGSAVIKYAQTIGYASSDIDQGQHVHTHKPPPCSISPMHLMKKYLPSTKISMVWSGFHTVPVVAWHPVVMATITYNGLSGAMHSIPMWLVCLS